jgi:hypothetical protein
MTFLRLEAIRRAHIGRWMTAIFLTALFACSVAADELQIARFDAARFFDQYQHTKDLRAAADRKRNVTGPQTDEQLRQSEKLGKLRTRNEEALAGIARAPEGSPESEQLEMKGRIAALELKIEELALNLEGQRQERNGTKEVELQRTTITGEIWAEAKVIASEKGYSVVIADGLSSDGIFVNVTVIAKIEDITDLLLARLNQRYSAKK